MLSEGRGEGGDDVECLRKRAKRSPDIYLFYSGSTAASSLLSSDLGSMSSSWTARRWSCRRLASIPVARFEPLSVLLQPISRQESSAVSPDFVFPSALDKDLGIGLGRTHRLCGDRPWLVIRPKSCWSVSSIDSNVRMGRRKTNSLHTGKVDAIGSPNTHGQQGSSAEPRCLEHRPAAGG
jgi:hypothetical protein